MSDLITYLFFFYKQKSAYDVRISDWGSDVCSSDLPRSTPRAATRTARLQQTDQKDQSDPRSQEDQRVIDGRRANGPQGDIASFAVRVDTKDIARQARKSGV